MTDRIASGKLVKEDRTWLVRVRRSMYTLGGQAKVTALGQSKIVTLGDIYALDVDSGADGTSEYVLAEFVDPTPRPDTRKPATQQGNLATGKQLAYAQKLWARAPKDRAGAAMTSIAHIPEPDWSSLTKRDASALIDTLTEHEM